MDKFLEFAGNNTLLVLALMISFFVLVFTELRRKASGLVAIDPTAAVSLINNNDDAVVIDLHMPRNEYIKQFGSLIKGLIDLDVTSMEKNKEPG